MRNTIALFLLIALPSCVFFGPSEQALYKKAVSNKPYDVIIVPGIPYDSTGNWDLTMKGRMYWSKHLIEKGIAKNVIYSGSAVYSPYIESEIMAMYGEKIGIPKTCIFSEKNAEHSTENIYYSYYMAKRLGFDKIAVATDPFQARMLRSYPSKMKVKMDFIPFVLDTLRTIQKEDYIRINADSIKLREFISIVDRETRFKRIWGTMGKNIVRDSLDVRNKK